MSAPLKRQPRATLGGPVQVNVGAHCIVGEMCTLSAGGVLVSGMPSLSPGTSALLFLSLPRSERLVVTEARTLYELPGTAVGFSFVALPPEESERVQRAVASAAAIYLTLQSLLQFAPERRRDIEDLCREVVMPAVPPVLLRPRVALALKRLQLAA